jgi:serine/threonine-protein kinase
MKPDNLLFTADGLPKVTDFGIAKILETTAATTTGMVGTPRYMAPEQIAGTRLGPATDLYALAVVLYELLAQRPPFEPSLPVAAVLHHHLSVPPQPLPEAPPAVAEVVLACLAKDPVSRHHSAQEFAVDLAHAGTVSFGPDWLSRSGVPVRLVDEVLAAAGHLSSGSTPPVAGHGGYGPPPTRRDATAFPSDTDPTSASDQPGAGHGHGGYPPSAVPPTRRDDGSAGVGNRRRLGVIAGVAALCVVAVGMGLAFALGAFRGEDDTSLASADPAYAGEPLTGNQYRTDGVAIGHDGTLYVTDFGSGSYDGRVLAISPEGTVRTVAGVDPTPDSGATASPTATPTTFGDGGPATSALLRNPVAVAVAPDGVLYVADYYGQQVRRVGTDGVITNFAGVGAGGDGFDGTSGEALRIELGYPTAVAVGPDGVVYVSTDTNILKITSDGRIAPLAAGDDGVTFTIPPPTPDPSAPATATADTGASPAPTAPAPTGLASVTDLAVGEDGMVYVVDNSLDVVVKIDPATGKAERVAGTGKPDYAGDDGPAVEASFNSPTGLAFGPDGSLYVADEGNYAIRRIDSNGMITTVAGGSGTGDGSDGADATTVDLTYLSGVAVDSSGAIYYCTYTNATVRRIDSSGILHTILATAD